MARFEVDVCGLIDDGVIELMRMTPALDREEAEWAILRELASDDHQRKIKTAQNDKGQLVCRIADGVLAAASKRLGLAG